MAEEYKSWPRARYKPGGGDAVVFYKVYGAFPTIPPAVSRSEHRCEGVPVGVEIFEQRRETHSDAFHFGLEGFFGEQLAAQASSVRDEVLRSPQCLVVRGTVADPATLDFFRNTIGLVTALLDGGGIAVFDPPSFRWWSGAEWRSQVFDTETFNALDHVLFMRSDDGSGERAWFHTRGMRKFGRPDLSVPGVVGAIEGPVAELMQRFAVLMADGEVVPQRAPIRMAGIPEGWCSFHEGSFDDPDFNNRHLFIGTPRLRHLTLPLETLDVSALLAEWHWLDTRGAHPFALSYFSDWLLEAPDGRVLILDTVQGQVRELASSRLGFEEGLATPENADEWLLAHLAFRCLDQGLAPRPGQCLGFKQPPILGGTLEVDNVEVIDLAVYQSVTAQIHEQVKGLPEGATVSITVDGKKP